MSRSQRAAHGRKLARAARRAGLRRRPSWSTASRRRAARRFKQPALAATLDQLAHAGLDDFYRGDVGREIAADLERVGSPVTRADLEALPRQCRRAAVGRRSTPARSTTRRRRRQGLASLMILALFDRLRRRRRRRASITCTAWSRRPSARLRVRDRVITDPDRLPHPPDRYLSDAFLDAEAQQDRPPQGRALAGARGDGRHHLDGRRRRLGPRRLLHPVALLGVRLRRACCRAPAC